MSTRRFTRRDFLKSSGLTAALLTAGRLDASGHQTLSPDTGAMGQIAGLSATGATAPKAQTGPYVRSERYPGAASSTWLIARAAQPHEAPEADAVLSAQSIEGGIR